MFENLDYQSENLQHDHNEKVDSTTNQEGYGGL
jgi:hypothetical protein